MGIISLKTKDQLGSLTSPANIDLGALIPISSIIISTSTSSATFSNIPQFYEHLQIRWSGKEESNGTSNWYGLAAQFNGDAGSNYSNHYLGAYAVTGGGGQTSFADNSSQAYMNVSIISRGNGDNITFGSGIIDILDYANTNKFKVMRSISGFIYNPTPNRIDYMSGTWRSTAAINTISLSNAGNFASGTRFDLYGIKRAGA